MSTNAYPQSPELNKTSSVFYQTAKDFIRRPDLSPVQKLICIYIGDNLPSFADTSAGRIARETGVSKRTVERNLPVLVERGVLVIKGTGTTGVHHYGLNQFASDGPAVDKKRRGSTQNVGTPPTKSVDLSTQNVGASTIQRDDKILPNEDEGQPPPPPLKKSNSFKGEPSIREYLDKKELVYERLRPHYSHQATKNRCWPLWNLIEGKVPQSLNELLRAADILDREVSAGRFPLGMLKSNAHRFGGYGKMFGEILAAGAATG